ncbi:DUF6159 family protein [Flaviaesturariibacter aridisoli]|uniref:Glycerophosphoryl diester phosphodiesterase membrane domain-containing protein n=1 Tax=Flaviaesturariibacter aridisoli TaxID=2545761 RepID=A0A4R4E846_9BACT|nr:DUF6159 family protein [Flaviaesturariibacter aridisoli]TCZ75000.1 hypothetical protein E0486_01455 [Flaviaesturariibacter aridisoli]
MSFFDRLSTGWRIALNSFSILRANKQLLIFPVLSGLSLLLIIGSFAGAFFAFADIDQFNPDNKVFTYGTMFVFYLVNYFVITFFNMALVHCTRLYFLGQEVSVREGIRFSVSRLPVIFSWALFAATVGTILRVIQENSGLIGKIITGIIGIVFSIATFFVVPVIAYEELGPIDAFKRSSQLMREKWGESLGSRFSFGVVNLLGLLLVVLPLFLLGFTVHLVLGIVLGLAGLFLLMTVMSAAHTVFISAVYHNVTGSPTEHFDQQLVDGLFQGK